MPFSFPFLPMFMIGPQNKIILATNELERELKTIVTEICLSDSIIRIRSNNNGYHSLLMLN